MRNDHNGDAELLVDFLEKVQDGTGGGRVQGAGGLITKQYLGIGR
ncbi:hypothetical protein SDC9_120944 [bioreactor metagenome]|uniref:Uncharacterized protein n=1 Tax=bioreactor metagenome TaxID=1076179 RepID=A0A645CAK9_9ZZZZ